MNLTETRFGGTRDLAGCPWEGSSEHSFGPGRGTLRGGAATRCFEVETAPQPVWVSEGRVAWQHVSPVFRSRESDGVATCRPGLAGLVGTGSPLSGGARGPANPGFSWYDRTGVPGSISMPFAVSGSRRGGPAEDVVDASGLRAHPREHGVRVVARRIVLRVTSGGAGWPRGHAGCVGGTNL